MELLQVELLNLLLAVLTFCASFATKYVVGLLKDKGALAKLEKNKELVKIVVSATEQVYTHLNGAEKLDKVKEELVKMLNENKVKISEKEIDLLIESVVKEMKDTAKKNK